MITFARDFVELNSNGLQIAYHRSHDIQVSVKTDTLTDMVFVIAHNATVLMVALTVITITIIICRRRNESVCDLVRVLCAGEECVLIALL